MTGKKPDLKSATERLKASGGDQARLQEASDTTRTLEQVYLENQRLGTLQTQALRIKNALGTNNGAPLLDAASKPGRHAVQFIKDIVKAQGPIPADAWFIRDYFFNPETGRGALPAFGQASVLAAKTAKDSVVIQPAFAQAQRLS